MSETELLADEDEIELLDLVGILIKNLKWILGISIFFAIIALGISILSILLPTDKSFLPNEYSPKTIVMLNSSENANNLSSMLNSSGLGSLAGLAGISSGDGSMSDSALAMKLVTTNSFINKINKEFKLDIIYKTNESDYPKTDLKKIITDKLSLKEDSNTGMLEIEYTDIDKELATNIVNKVTDLLEEEFDKIDAIRNKDQFVVINEQMAIVEADLERLQQEIIAFQSEHNMMDVGVVSEALVEKVTEFQAELLQKEVEIESYGRVSSIKDPAYVKLINERDAIQNAIDKLQNGEVGDFPPVKDLPQLALELTALQQEADIRLSAYKALVAQSESLKLTAKGTGSTFQVLEYAEVPEMKSGPSRGKLCIIVTFAGFFFSIFFVFLKEAFMNIKNDPEKMKRLRGEV